MLSKRAVKADIASIPKLIPVNLLGDGMVRILGIVMKIASTKGGVVVIDEIESGFHYSLKSDEIQSLGYSLSIPDSPNTFSDSDLRVGIFIIENELEDLCLKSLKFPEVEPCVDKFFKCLPKNLEENIKKRSKVRLQTYLSAMNEHCNSLGMAVQKRYFDRDAKALEPLKAFLMCLKQAD